MDDFQIFQDTLVKYHGKVSNICIPKGVKKIGDHAFHGCKEPVSVKIPETVTEIGMSAFRNCEHLQSVDIPESVITIKERAFDQCHHLTHIRLPDNLKNIGVLLFSNDAPLESYPGDFVIHNNTLIQYRGNAETVIIPEGVTHIHDYAFDFSMNSKHLILPESIQSFSSEMTGYRTPLKSIEWHHIRIKLLKERFAVQSAMKLIQHIHEFLQNPEIHKIKEIYIMDIFLHLDHETFRKMVYTGKLFQDPEIDAWIRYAIELKLYEKQLILMNYKAEHIGYDTIENTIKKKFDL